MGHAVQLCWVPGVRSLRGEVPALRTGVRHQPPFLCCRSKWGRWPTAQQACHEGLELESWLASGSREKGSRACLLCGLEASGRMQTDHQKRVQANVCAHGRRRALAAWGPVVGTGKGWQGLVRLQAVYGPRLVIGRSTGSLTGLLAPSGLHTTWPLRTCQLASPEQTVRRAREGSEQRTETLVSFTT